MKPVISITGRCPAERRSAFNGIAAQLAGSDVVLTEDEQSSGKPSFEVLCNGRGDRTGPPPTLEDPAVVGVLSDDLGASTGWLQPLYRPVRAFARDDYQGVTRFIMARLLPPLTDLVGIVLAGGKSRRMGEDKALIELGGESLLARQVRRLGHIAREVIVVGPGRAIFDQPGVRTVRDSDLGNGPLAGVYAGLQAAGGSTCVVTGVDMPFFGLDLAVHAGLLLAGVYGPGPKDAVLPVDHLARLEPLHGVYSSHCLGAIRALFSREPNPSFRDFQGVADTLVLDTATTSWFGDPALMFMNINTPADLERARTLLKAGGAGSGPY